MAPSYIRMLYLSIGGVLQIGVHPSITDTQALQVLGIDGIALHNHLPSSWYIVASYITTQYSPCPINIKENQTKREKMLVYAKLAA